MSKSELAGIIVAAIFIYFLLVFAMAALSNYAMNRFGFEWTDFWGWAAIYAVLPFIRVWVSARGN